jgi:gliding motility-associated-like protein
VNQWLWTFDSTLTSNLQDTSVNYSVFGQKQASLIVSNGVCSDTASSVVNLDNALAISFEATNLVCPGEKASFENNSTGKIIAWNWDFGNGNSSSLQSPAPQTYFIVDKVDNYPVTLTIQDSVGCRDSLTQYVEVVDNCYIAVPSAFTPNGDGLNDYLYPLNAYRAINLNFKVFNRWGQLVFETADWTKKWDGRFKNQQADAGTYVWVLQYTDSETGKQHFTKGTSLLIR